MKLAIVLLCVVAAVQGRSTAVKAVKNERSVADSGENPWMVHLRVAISTSGLLESCTGVLIDASWVLTTAYCVRDARFIWNRFDATEVIRPGLVIETSNVIRNAGWNQETNENNIALVNLNRVIDLTNICNIAVIALPAANSEVPRYAKYCAYGETPENTAGEWLRCWVVYITGENQQTVIYNAEDISVTQSDSGAPVVSEGILVGLLSQASESGATEGVFIRVDNQVNWIRGMTGLDFNTAAPGAPEGTNVTIVN